MSFEITWTSIGVILAILAHAYHTVSWSSRITTQLESLGRSLDFVHKELEKRDAQIAAAWKKIDGMDIRMAKVETKCSLHHVED